MAQELIQFSIKSTASLAAFAQSKLSINFLLQSFPWKPVKNYAEWRLAYFIPFLMLGGFLVLNMIVGVVVENFQRCRERLEDEEKQRRRRKMLDKARSKNQQGGYYLPFALVVLRLQFQPLEIIS